MKKYVSRRNFLKTGFTGLAAVAACGFLPAGPAAGAEGQAKNPENRNILIAYFSHSGKTRHVAEQIHERIGGDILKIETVTPYPEDYDPVEFLKGRLRANVFKNHFQAGSGRFYDSFYSAGHGQQIDRKQIRIWKAI